ncbi:hypothetical protein BIV57_16470 [Mangrovactinospora gilvigrisea]|uniref:DUF3040 domain-containing protein n=1 Tax=Mangrovactinospora gilvigrisea TaxID=1428644 RepID=A0A1J7BCN1_9ACTN|nr:DUF3040 domain-containing protein [Mangrovactinospora gilvigrisea]OIV36414.1 hypothetical protein BIV57_16470 [Mangrovactinospora gilvigrisea]
MPLSEHEQRLLEQMERALYAEDPKFATALEGSRLRLHTRKRVYQAVGGLVVGVALLVAGVMVKGLWPISVVGFLVVLGSGVLAVAAWRGGAAAAPGAAAPGAPGTGPAKASRKLGGRQKRRVTDRLEERWQRRQDERGR